MAQPSLESLGLAPGDPPDIGVELGNPSEVNSVVYRHEQRYRTTFRKTFTQVDEITKDRSLNAGQRAIATANALAPFSEVLDSVETGLQAAEATLVDHETAFVERALAPSFSAGELTRHAEIRAFLNAQANPMLAIADALGGPHAEADRETLLAVWYAPAPMKRLRDPVIRAMIKPALMEGVDQEKADALARRRGHVEALRSSVKRARRWIAGHGLT